MFGWGYAAVHKIICRACKLTYELDAPVFEAGKTSGAIQQGDTTLAAGTVYVGLCARCESRDRHSESEVAVELSNLALAVRALELEGFSRPEAIAKAVENQMKAQEHDPGFRTYLEFGGSKPPAGWVAPSLPPHFHVNVTEPSSESFEQRSYPVRDRVAAEYNAEIERRRPARLVSLTECSKPCLGPEPPSKETT